MKFTCGIIRQFRHCILAAILFLSIACSGIGKLEEDPSLIVAPDSLKEWSDKRFGMFIHWGPWAQTEIGYIWKITLEDSPEERERRFELYKTFDPTRFAPRKWARAARRAGMKYVVFVTKHHDGMNNYDTQLSNFKIPAEECPYSDNANADLTRAVVDAFRAEGLAIGFYYSNIDWHHPDGKYYSISHWDYDPGKVDTDPESWKRFVNYQTGQLRELLSNYGKIDILWLDLYWAYAGEGREPVQHPVVRKDVLDMLAMIKQLQPGIVFNDRGTDIYGGFYTPEQRVPETGLPGHWEVSMTMTEGRGYWYKGAHTAVKKAPELIRHLVDTASKGGNLLLNVGPDPLGELLPETYRNLETIGDWMNLNGASIYGTTRGRFYDLPWGYSTTRGNTVYLQVFDWPTDGILHVPGLISGVKAACLLANEKRQSLSVSYEGTDCLIEVGPDIPTPIAGVVVLELTADARIRNFIRSGDHGSIELRSGRAEIESTSAQYNYGRTTRHGNFIENIQSTGDRISWDFSVQQAGPYRVKVLYAVNTGEEGSTFSVNIDETGKLTATTQATADWEGPILEVRSLEPEGPGSEIHDNRWLFREHDIGTIRIPRASTYRLTLRPEELKSNQLMYLKSVTLIPE